MSIWTPLDQLLQDEARPASHLMAPVALSPVWSRADFIAQARTLAAALHRAEVRAVALHAEDAARFGCALLACALDGIPVYLPPNLADDNVGWADGVADLWLTDGLLPPSAQRPVWLLHDDGPRLADGQPVAHDEALAIAPASIGVAMAARDTRAIPAAATDTTPVPDTAPTPAPTQALAPTPTRNPTSAVAACQPAARTTLRLDTRLVLKTSGSTGRPQIVEKTLGQFQEEAEALRRACSLDDLGAVDAVIGSVSPQHLYGLSFRVVLSLCAGWPIHRAQCVYPESLLEAAMLHPRAVWISSPVLLNNLGEDRVADSLRGRVALLVSSGGSLPDATCRRLRHHLGVEVSNIYGSTETGVIAWRRGDGPWRVPQPARWGVDTQGALWIESAWSNGRQQTHDAVIAEADGFVLQGRIDRIIKLADKRLSLQQIEHELLMHDWVRDVHTGLHPVHRRLAACVALSESGIMALREQGRQGVVLGLRTHLLRTQDPVALPRTWRFDTVLPRNAQGKLRHDDFLQMLDRRLTGPIWHLAEGSDDAHLRAEGVVPLDLVHFAGHFPRHPIVPGVVELDWVVQLARRHFACPSRLFRADALKFRQLVRPNDTLQLALDWHADQRKLNFSIAGPQGACASGRLLFAETSSPS